MKNVIENEVLPFAQRVRTGMKIPVIFSAVFFGAVSCAWPGINTVNFGLPTSTAYGVPLEGNAASTMCVDCHSASPVVNAGGREGSHFVIHNAGAAVRTTNNTAWEKVDAWASGYLSKYASPAPPDPAAASVTGLAGEMICESCHNLITNAAGGNNLIMPYDELSEPTALCEGCHSAQATGQPNHHPLSNDNVGPDDDDPSEHILNVAHTSHLLADPIAGSDVTYSVVGVSRGVNCASCHTPHGGAKGAGARVLKYGASASSFPGSPVNLIYYDDNPIAGDISGEMKVWDTGDVQGGVDRQYDVTETFGSPYRLIINQDPLCDACHSASP